MIKAIKILLIPFIPVYALIMAVRNMFFDIGLFKTRKVSARVLSVGNLTMGGSGKTPLVIYLLDVFKDRNINAAVLSRGYGRKSKGYRLVSDGSEILAGVDESGDEIYYTVMRSNMPAAVSENRVKGAKKLIDKTAAEVIVLDDAFQHRWIHRDLNLLIFEQRFLLEPFSMNKFLLPSGILREPFRAIGRADAVIINRKFSEKKNIPGQYKKYFDGKPVFTAYYTAKEFVELDTGTVYSISEFSGQKSLVVSGVANPFSFINVLNQSNVDTSNRMIFRDHKNYTNDEIQKIRKQFYLTNSHSVVTTEKDSVKLLKFSRELDDIDIFFLKIEISFDDEVEFRNFILNKTIMKNIKI